jgi:pimeloyl-ACP methyl ester carboxylesterase
MGRFLGRYLSEKRAALERLQAASKLVETTRGPVEFAQEGHGPAVLISHGGAGGYDMGIWLARLIGGESRFIAPSRFGYLRASLPSEPTPAAQADAYVGLLDVLDIERVSMIGLSAGGLSALQFALNYPQRCRGLVMLSAMSRRFPPLPPLLKVAYALMVGSDWLPWLLGVSAPEMVYRGNGINRALLARIRSDEEKMRLLSELQKTTFPASVRREGNVNDLQQAASVSRYPLEQIDLPTLVVHAVDDPVVPYDHAEHTADSIVDAELLSLPEGGHFCAVTHRETVVPEIRGFLNRYRFFKTSGR